MNLRERILAGALVGIVLVGGAGFGVWKVFLPMLQTKERERADLETRLKPKELEIDALKAKKAQLEDWRHAACPSTPRAMRTSPGPSMTATWTAWSATANSPSAP